MMSAAKKVFNIMVITLLLNMPVVAEDVQMFTDRAPSAEEMGSILFAEPDPVTKSAIRMRGIKFSNTATKPTSVPTDPDTMIAQAIGLPITFALNSDKIRSESKSYLDEVGKMLNLSDYAAKSLVIEGHTDASGSKGYNQQLSQKRAKAVKNYLVSNYQISADRFKVVGKGESAPLKGTNPFDGSNRRVQFYQAQ